MEKLLTTSSGRYKILKLIQYISRFILLQVSAKRLSLPLTRRRQLRTLISQCSLQRRILQLGNVYYPLKFLLFRRGGRTKWGPVFSALAGVTEDVSEDMLTLSQLGWIPERFSRMGVYADRAWLVSLILDLRVWAEEKGALIRRKRMERLLDQRYNEKDGGVRTRKQELREEEWWLDLDGLRVMCDAGQAWCDVFDVQVFEGFNVYCALTSAVLGIYRFVGR